MIAHKKLKVFFIGIAILLSVCMAIPSFASPSLSDADITFSLRGGYSQWFVPNTWHYNSTIDSETGEVISFSGYSLVSDSFPVYYGGTICTFSNRLPYAGIGYVAFYDSNMNFIQKITYSPSATFVSPIAGASFARIEQRHSGSFSIVSSPSNFDRSNYSIIYSTFSSISVDSDGVIYIPYQVVAFSRVWLDFSFYSSTYKFSNISYKYQVEFFGNDSLFSGLVGFGDGYSYSETYFTIDGVNTTSSYGSNSNNPGSYVLDIHQNNFSGFLLDFPVNVSDSGTVTGVVSVGLKVTISDFALDGEAVDSEFKVNSSLNDLNNLIEDLALPSPDSSVLFGDVGSVINNVNDNNARSFMASILTNDGIITTLMVISISITVLGYILFGKKDA